MKRYDSWDMWWAYPRRRREDDVQGGGQSAMKKMQPYSGKRGEEEREEKTLLRMKIHFKWNPVLATQVIKNASFKFTLYPFL